MDLKQKKNSALKGPLKKPSITYLDDENDNNITVSLKKKRTKDSRQVRGHVAQTGSAGLEESSTATTSQVNPQNEASHCPICQVPFFLLKIAAEVHTAKCEIPEGLPDCPLGSECENENMFHYRDFGHRHLAVLRDREDYTPHKSPKKLLKTPPRKRSSAKKRSMPSPASNPRKMSRPELALQTEGQKKKLFTEEPHSSSSIPVNNCSVQSIKEEPLVWPNDIVKVELENDAILHSEVDLNSQESDQRTLRESEDEFPLNSEQVDLNLLETQNSASEVLKQIKTESLEAEEHLNYQGTGLLDSSSCDIPPRHHFTANLALNYDFNPTISNHQVVNKNWTSCKESCFMTADSDDTIQASCSVTIRSSGMKTQTATVLSPITVNLMMNNTGWEAMSVKGRASANVEDITVNLCRCQRSLNVACLVKDSENVLCDTSIQEDKAVVQLKEVGVQTSETSHVISINSGNPATTNLVTPVKDENDPPSVACGQALTDTSRSATSGVGGHIELPRPSTSAACGESSSYNYSRPASPTSCINSKPVDVTKKSFFGGSSSRAHVSNSAQFKMVASKSSSSSWTVRAVKGSRFLNSGARKLPVYKRIPDTPFVVDAFNYGVIPHVKVYFLSHFHSDHYIGLRKDFNRPIFCSKVTANLVRLKLGVSHEYLHVLELGEPRVILGVEVEVFDANHCPGAVMFLFRLADGRTYLHVGDFRANDSMEQFPRLRFVDKLFLDTTYCDPTYDFPAQEEVIDKVIQTARNHLNDKSSTLFVCGSYTIGKEKVFRGLAETFGWKIWATSEKMRVLRCLEDPKLMSYFTSDPSRAQVHVLPMKDIAVESLESHLHKFSPRFSCVVGFKPTGWTTSRSLKGKVTDFQKHARGKVTIYGVPYSEHSSFSELRQFVRFIRPADIQVTVNVSKSTQFKKYFQQWLANSSESNGQSSMLKYLYQKM